jgi:6-phosphogluconolactonase
LHSSVSIFATPYLLAEKFAGELAKMATESAVRKIPVSIALSGGSTPEILYTFVGNKYGSTINWEFVHFFWCDERCVAPEEKESNYGMTKRALLDRLNIPAENIHRIKGENDPGKEAVRYSSEISDLTRSRDGFPVFDLIILGLGEDGHTASIFPADLSLMESEMICETASHPLSLQKRITITGRVINNADIITFIVTGKNKAEIVDKIINKKSGYRNFPASLVAPVYGNLRWLLDKESAVFL